MLDFHLNNNGLLKIEPNDIDSGTTDNSNYVKLELSKSEFSCSHLGDQELFVKAFDYSNNITVIKIKVKIKNSNSYGTIFSKINVTQSNPCKDMKVASINMDLIGGTEPFEYLWSLNNKFIDYKNQKNLDSLGAGFYKVQIKDINNCLKTDSVKITEPLIYLPVIKMSSDTSICFGKSVEISAIGGIIYQWYSNDNLNVNSTSSLIVTPKINSVYKVKVTDFQGCENLDSVHVNIRSLPDVKIYSIKNEICIGSQIDLSATGGVIYTWVPAENYFYNNLNTVRTKIFNTSILSVIGSDSFGCEKRDTLYLKVNPLPKVIISNSDSICEGMTKQLFATGGISYSWTGIGLDKYSINNPLATPLVTTKFLVNVTSDKGCLSKDSTTITVIDNPVQSIISGNFNVCQNSNWNEYFVETRSDLIRDWNIINGTKKFNTNSKVYINWDSGSLGKIILSEKMTNYPFCFSDKSHDVIFMNSIAKPAEEILIKGNTLNSNILISKQIYPIMIWGFETKSDFKEIITCENSNWCKYSLLDTFTQRYWLKTGDSLNCLQKSYLNWPSYLSNPYFQNTKFNVFPNPAAEILYISNGENVTSVRLFNNLGSLIISTNYSVLKINHLPIGTYFVEVIDRFNNKSNHKVLIFR